MRKKVGGPNYKKIVAKYIQTMINEHTGKKVLVVDSAFGPATDAALHKLVYGVYPKKPKKTNGSIITKPARPEWTKHLPRGTVQKKKYFGNPGDNLVRMTFPYKMYYAGKLVKTTRVNIQAKDRFEAVFKKLLAHYGQAELDRLRISDYGGLVNIRRIRGGTAWSSHAFGAAIDLGAAYNRMGQHADTALFASSTDYQAMFNIFYSEGFISLGLEHGYDFMHLSLER
jgi:hypothetical protein